MALARVTTWVAGQVLTAAALNAEYDNVINNPISLISPTTGAINFNLSAHTNLIVAALSATSGSTGQALLISTGGVPIWSSTGAAGGFTNFTSFSSGQIPVGTTSGALAPIAIGTTGQVLAITSSNSTPAWQVVPISGGLTSGVSSTGAIFYVTSSGVLAPLTIGTSGQVLTVTSSLSAPGWAAAAAGGGGGTVFSSQIVYLEEFQYVAASTALFFADIITAQQYYSQSSAGATVTFAMTTSGPGGHATFSNSAVVGTLALAGASTVASAFPFWTSQNPDMTIRVAQGSTVTSTRRFGMVAPAAIGTADPTDGLYFRFSANSTIIAVARVGSAETIINTTGVATSSGKFDTLRIQVTSSGTLATVFVNGVSQGTFTSSAIAGATPLTMAFGNSGVVSSALRLDGWQIIMDRSVTV